MEIRMVKRMLQKRKIIGSYCIEWVRQEYNKHIVLNVLDADLLEGGLDDFPDQMVVL